MLLKGTTFEEAFSAICAMEAPLNERLSAFTAIHRQYWEPFFSAYDELIQKLKATDCGATAPRVGDRLTPFLLPNVDGRLVSLEELLAQGPLVVSFNRGHWCEYCDLELRAFASAHDELSGMGARVVAILPEQGHYLRKIDLRSGRTFTLLCDADNGYALELGLVMWLGERVREVFINDGLTVQHYQGNDGWFVPIPATFVVGLNGIIAARFVDPDFRLRMDIEEIIAVLKQLSNGNI